MNGKDLDIILFPFIKFQKIKVVKALQKSKGFGLEKYFKKGKNLNKTTSF